MSAALVGGVSDETAEVVGVALGELRDGDREILLLSAWEDLDLSEIAAVLECSRAAAGVRLHRARRRLGVALESARRGVPQPRNAEVTS
jgi:RNA polymerase sigma-70 factor (ECF subfamily)